MRNTNFKRLTAAAAALMAVVFLASCGVTESSGDYMDNFGGSKNSSQKEEFDSVIDKFDIDEDEEPDSEESADEEETDSEKITEPETEDITSAPETEASEEETQPESSEITAEVFVSEENNTASDWKSLYIQKLSEKVGTNCTGWELAYIDGDEIPELIICNGYAHVDGCEIYTIKNGNLIQTAESAGVYGTVVYLEKKGILYLSNMGMGYYSIAVQKMNENGQLSLVISGDNNEAAVSDLADVVYHVNDEEVTEEVFYNTFKNYELDESMKPSECLYGLNEMEIMEVMAADDPMNPEGY